jgi:hypothetical protein
MLRMELKAAARLPEGAVGEEYTAEFSGISSTICGLD